jgi:hypothetical protein
MKIKSFFLLIILLCSSLFSNAQSKTTEALQKKYDAMAFFFYNNTLRMLNQTEDKAFDELIKNIEKMKFLMINKTSDSFDAAGYKKVVNDYKSEKFEEIMTSRYEGKNFDIFIKGTEKKTEAMLVLVNDEKSLYVLDILGSIALNRVTELYNTIDSSSDIGKRIKAFAGDHKDDDDDDDKDDDRKEKSDKVH